MRFYQVMFSSTILISASPLHSLLYLSNLPCIFHRILSPLADMTSIPSADSRDMEMMAVPMSADAASNYEPVYIIEHQGRTYVIMGAARMHMVGASSI